MPATIGELGRNQYSSAFNELLDLIIKEVDEWSGSYLPEVDGFGPEDHLSERSLKDDAFPRVFFGYDTRLDEQFPTKPNQGIAHANIVSLASGRGRHYQHVLTADGKVLREVVRSEGPQIPVEQPRVLNDEAIRGLIRHLSA